MYSAVLAIGNIRLVRNCKISGVLINDFWDALLLHLEILRMLNATFFLISRNMYWGCYSTLSTPTFNAPEYSIISQDI